MSSTSQPPRKTNALAVSDSSSRQFAVKYLVVHCADTPDDQGFSAADVHGWHLERGWSGIGYHAVITRDGQVQQGRPDYWIGAHVKGHNSGSLGVCLIGRSEFTPAQLSALRRWLDEKARAYPLAGVVGHRDLDGSKTCPNFDAREWYGAGAPESAAAFP